MIYFRIIDKSSAFCHYVGCQRLYLVEANSVGDYLVGNGIKFVQMATGTYGWEWFGLNI